MPLQEAIPFLKGAVARSLPGGASSIYTFSSGVMYAQNASTLAAYPVPYILGEFALAADDIEAALGRMSTEPAVEAGDGTLILRAGRLRSSIELLSAELPGHTLPDLDWEPPPDGLLPAIDKVLPFISPDGTWQRGVWLGDGRVRAVSNMHAIEVDVPDLAVDGPTALTDDAAKYLAGLPEPSGWKRIDGALAFSWPSGAWVRCQLATQEWPALVDRLFAEHREKGTTVTITDEWREAFADVTALGEGTVDIGPEGMVGRSQHAEHVASFATGVANETRWQLKALAHVIGVAETWDALDRTSAFLGPSCRGIIAAMARG